MSNSPLVVWIVRPNAMHRITAEEGFLRRYLKIPAWRAGFDYRPTGEPLGHGDLDRIPVSRPVPDISPDPIAGCLTVLTAGCSRKALLTFSHPHAGPLVLLTLAF